MRNCFRFINSMAILSATFATSQAYAYSHHHTLDASETFACQLSSPDGTSFNTRIIHYVYSDEKRLDVRMEGLGLYLKNFMLANGVPLRNTGIEAKDVSLDEFLDSQVDRSGGSYIASLSDLGALVAFDHAQNGFLVDAQLPSDPSKSAVIEFTLRGSVDQNNNANFVITLPRRTEGSNLPALTYAVPLPLVGQCTSVQRF